jgi:diaminopimelate epimerase
MESKENFSKVKKSKFAKMEIWHGANNLFLIKSGNKILKNKIKELIKKNKTDGLILVNILSKRYIDMKFYNPDGSIDNCGNGLRVAAKYCYDKKYVKKQGKIFSFKQNFEYFIKDNVTIIFDNIKKEKNLWNIGGVLHKVYRVKSIKNSREKAIKLREKYDANITLIREVNNKTFAQTFERGVENFTYSCGTGAIAASLFTKKEEIFMPGGLLKIKNKNNKILLIGNAVKIKNVEK